MQQSIARIALVVRDYDEAIDFYVGALGFTLVEDAELADQNKRWVVVAPPGGHGAELLLAQASDETQAACIGNQSGGRVFLLLYTNHFYRDYEAFRSHGVEFTEAPRTEVYGTVAVFKDLYGNLWDLLQPTGAAAQ